MIDRLGESKLNKFGSLMTIIEYNKHQDITVKFEDSGSLVKAQYGSFESGYIKNPYDPMVYGHGYIGEGSYKSGKTGHLTRQYATWKGMLQRCYDPKFQSRQPMYIGCSVDKEWHNFQTFAKWYDENYYEIDGQTMSLDKDILIKGNKIYSKDTAIFAPRLINNLFIKHIDQRGDFPIGVSYQKKSNKYIVRCGDGTGNKNRSKLGSYTTSEEAFEVYKPYKEKIIKQVADQYENKIPQKLYDAMYRYIIEITD
jgi:hypothetical protein